MKGRFVAIFALILAVLANAGCYRTLYVQFSPENPDRLTEPAPRYLGERKSGQQSFFLYGWAPGTREINAEKLCGGTDRIESIRTGLTFGQGLLGLIAGYYIINIYSPYNGAVYCKVSR